MRRLWKDLRYSGRMLKNKLFRERTVVALIILVSAIWLSTLARLTWRLLPAAVEASSGGRSDGGGLQLLAPLACTIFTAAYGETVLFGNNEDYINPKTYYWVVPAKAGNYGCIFFGFDNFFPQGGINEKGLAFDGNAIRLTPLTPHPELLPMKNSQHFLEQCATVEEALQWAKRYNWGTSFAGQIHLADPTGAAAVIGPGADGELAFTRKKRGDGYFISTNFNLANPNAGGFPCQRYETVTRMFERRNAGEALTVDYVRSVLDATHQEGAGVNTVYSNIFDLRQGVIYLYHWHQFDEVVVLKVADELANGPARRSIRELFSKLTVERAASEYEGHHRMFRLRRFGPWTWLFLTAGSMGALIWKLRRRPRMSLWKRLVWGGVVAFLGVFGLLAYLISSRESVSG